jgi:hypothetical protein
MSAAITNPSINETLIYNEDSYVLWAPYLNPSVISDFMAYGGKR